MTREHITEGQGHVASGMPGWSPWLGQQRQVVALMYLGQRRLLPPTITTHSCPPHAHTPGNIIIQAPSRLQGVTLFQRGYTTLGQLEKDVAGDSCTACLPYGASGRTESRATLDPTTPTTRNTLLHTSLFHNHSLNYSVWYCLDEVILCVLHADENGERC